MRTIALATLLLADPALAQEMVVVPTTPPPPIDRREPPPGATIARARLGPHSTLIQLPDGSLALERTARHDRPKVWKAGLAVLAVSYGTTALLANFPWVVHSQPFLAVPFAGPLALTVMNHQPWVAAVAGIDMALQIGGFATLVVGLFSAPRRHERVPLLFTPLPIGAGGGVAVLGAL